MKRSGIEYQSLPAKGAFDPSDFVKSAGQRPFVGLRPHGGTFTSGVPLADASAAPPGSPASASVFPAANLAPEPPTARSARLEARVAELEAELTAQGERHATELRVSLAEGAAALAHGAERDSRGPENAQRLASLIAELARLREKFVAEMRAEAGAVLLVGARRLAGQALQTQPGALEALVEECVAALGGTTLLIRVNPDDVERVAAAVGPGVRVVPDPSVRAGCVAEGEGTRVEATIEGSSTSLAAELAAWKRLG